MRHAPHIPPLEVNSVWIDAVLSNHGNVLSGHGALLLYDDVVCIAVGTSHNRRPVLPLPGEASFEMLTGMLPTHTNLRFFLMCDKLKSFELHQFSGYFISTSSACIMLRPSRPC